MSIIAATGFTLTRDRLAPWIDAAHVRADRAAQTPGIARAIRIHVFEIIELLGRQSALRAIAFWGQCQRNAVAPPSAHLGGEQFGIDLVLVRLEKLFEPNDVRLDHLEHREAAVQAEFSGLRHQIVLGVVPQHKQPGFARLLVIQRISLRATANRSHADAVGVTEMNLERGDWLTVSHFHQRHPVGTPDFPKGTAFSK